MKIKAKYGFENVTIIAFVPSSSSSIRAIYVREDGKLGTCYVESSVTKPDNCMLTITDENYIPAKEIR